MNKKSKTRRYIEIIFNFSLLMLILYMINNVMFNQAVSRIENEVDLFTSNEFELHIKNIEKDIDQRWLFVEIFGEIFSDTADLVEEKNDIETKLKKYKEKYNVEEIIIIDDDYNYVASSDNLILNKNYLPLVNKALNGERSNSIDENDNVLFVIPIKTDNLDTLVIIEKINIEDVIKDFNTFQNKRNNYYAVTDSKGEILLYNGLGNYGNIMEAFDDIGASDETKSILFTSISNNLDITTMVKKGKNSEYAEAKVLINSINGNLGHFVAIHNFEETKILSHELRYTMIIVILMSLLLFTLIYRNYSKSKNFIIGELEDDNRSLSDEQLELKKISEKDPFTGLYNKSETSQKIDKEIEDNELQRSTLYMIDIDEFKKINDTYGHLTGDQVLLKVVDVLNETFEKSDLIGRIGGDEFVVYRIGTFSRLEVETKAKQLLENIRNIFMENYDLNVSVTIGIAKFPEDGDNFQDLLWAADKAMYEYKHNNKKGEYNIYKEN